MKESDLKFLNEQSDELIVTAIRLSQPKEKRTFNFKIYHQDLKQGLGRRRLRDEILEAVIVHFEQAGFVVKDHPDAGMMRLSLDLMAAVFTPAQARLFNEHWGCV
jgi:hypothetical protein